ncbi:ComEC/Rec2 family competence protein [Novosphingobium pentaromativorans]|uniref:Competence protein ComEC n=1 Tax=Novosphingobium pentaromativorans US6-1 TaxID=1088721 RepID=G6EIP5_9SPHN|nr:ComEC/Rec2 family competence protein [Novosphingobium pentaromativorans]AIT78861.1 metal-binding protein [Novosphingobium pentaromativorans US6-1]EHJ58987.1 competence protein ComEC [Novosphingobium pentaromativorans US6-1]
MASQATAGDDENARHGLVGGAALQHRPWNSKSDLSRVLAALERFLSQAGFDRGPWLVVAFAAGIGTWFGLPGPLYWSAFAGGAIAIAALAGWVWPDRERFAQLRLAICAVFLMFSAGCLTVWAKSVLAGQEAIERPISGVFLGKVLGVDEQPALERVRWIVAAREPDSGVPIKVRVNVPADPDAAPVSPGAVIRFEARLMPPAAPMFPGGYNFARTAWFSGLSASGSVTGRVTIVEPGTGDDGIDAMRTALSRHVRSRMAGSEGGIAAALASGDRGGILEEDAQAMRDAGLAHLLAISGLHVSAVIGAAYFLALRLLALCPALALRLRLPVVAALCGALAGIAYTVLTGSQVPTVRSCIGAMLVLIALALGREALSLRMLAVAGFIVLLVWPESLTGPSFQMSFAAVLAIVALATSGPARQFLAPREESWLSRLMRQVVMLFVTGFVIEVVLMPIGFYHFHRAGAYGALANVLAIPLTTFAVMPCIALALLCDIVGLGGPFWWLAGQFIDLLLGLAHKISALPGAVSVLPAMGTGGFLLFVTGGLWLGLWSGRVRLLGLVPACFGIVWLILLEPPDILVTGDGRHVGLLDDSGDGLVTLRDTGSDYVRDNLREFAGIEGELTPLASWPGSRCNRDFCSVRIDRAGRSWDLLIARGRDQVPERSLAAACDKADIVVADRWLPWSCKPRWLKADRTMLDRTGGLAIRLRGKSVETVAAGQGRHGWWNPRGP